MTARRWPDMTRRVASDDLTIKFGDEEFHPHAGEYVVMKQKTSVWGMSVALRFWSMAQEGADVSNVESVNTFTQAMLDFCDVLADTLLEWTWTGEDGKPYPSPANNAKYLSMLHIQELLWLAMKYQEPAEVPKN